MTDRISEVPGAREVSADAPESPRAVVRISNTIIHVLDVIALWIFAIALIGELIVMVGNVIARTWFDAPFQWIFEIADLSMPLLVFVGGAWAYSADRHIRLDVLIKHLTPSWRASIDAFSDTSVLFITIAVFVSSLPVIIAGESEHTQILNIPQSVYNAMLTGGMAILIVYCLLRLVRYHIRELAKGVALAVVLGAAELLLAATSAGSEAVPNNDAAWIILISFAVLLVLGVPVAFVLLNSSMLYLAISAAAPMDSVVTSLMGSTQNYVDLAIPFFIFAGILVTFGGLTTGLTAFFERILRRVRGGLLHVVVVSMYIFSGVSGSKVADVAAVGSALRDDLAREGYPKEETSAVLAASAVMGEAVPPSLVMLLLGSVTSVSITGLFLAGLVPAAMVGVAIVVLIFFKSKPRRLPKERLEIGEFVRLGVGALPALIFPVVLIGGIVSGIASPTEIASVAALLGFIILIVHRRSAKRVIDALKETCAIGGMVLLIVSSASAFSFSLTLSGLPTVISNLFSLAGGRPYIVLLITLVLVPLTGMVLEGAPAVLILAPLLLPVATATGINPLQYSIVFVLAMGLGTYAPPMGLGLYAVCAVMEAPVSSVTRRMAPFWAVILCTVLIIAFIPEVSLWLPNWLS